MEDTNFQKILNDVIGEIESMTDEELEEALKKTKKHWATRFILDSLGMG